MNIYFYIIIFIMGIMFGSFYTLAVYRVPKGQDITHTHSYCPNCGNKLGFFELIPVLSYIFLRGKCKRCKQRIRIRYLILEILSGILFVLFALGLNLSIYNLTPASIISCIFIVLYLTCVILIAGIDKENKNIHKSLLAYGIIISIIYIIYLYIVEKASIHRYAIYLILMIVLLIIDNICLKKKAQSMYAVNLLILILIMLIFTGEYICTLSVLGLLITIAIYILINKFKDKKRKVEQIYFKNLKLAFVLVTFNIVFLLLTLLIMRV